MGCIDYDMVKVSVDAPDPWEVVKDTGPILKECEHPDGLVVRASGSENVDDSCTVEWEDPSGVLGSVEVESLLHGVGLMEKLMWRYKMRGEFGRVVVD